LHSFYVTYILIKYIKSVLWRIAKRLSYIEDARRLKVKGKHATASQHHFPVHEPITLQQDTLFARSALQLTSAQLLSTKLLMLACFRQTDLFSLFFFFFSSVLNLKALWNCMSAVRIHKDRPSVITIDIQLLTC
jgi:hypothetical protein